MSLAARVTSRLFPQAQDLVYQMWVGDRLLATHWTSYRGERAAGVHRFDLLLELDPRALASGGSLVRSRAHLDCDGDLAPLRYLTETAGAVVRVTFARDAIRVLLPDGQEQLLDGGRAEAVSEAYHVGLDALLWTRLALSGRLEGELAVQIFLVNQLISAPYTLRPAEGGGWATSYGEVVALDPDAVVSEVRADAHGVRVARVVPPPPPPSWKDALLAPIAPHATYAPPADAPLSLHEVDIPGGEVPLGAALTIPHSAGPHGAGPFPAVLFIGGSGLHDRHGLAGEVDLGSHEIVDHLSGRGYVGLRLDKRGAGRTATGPDPLNPSLTARIDDVDVALAWLLARPEVDPRRVFLVGHSEGATVALALAVERRRPVAGVALLATRVSGMDAVIFEQVRAVARQQGLGEDHVERQLAEARALFEAVASGEAIAPGSVPDLVFASARSIPWLRDHLRLDIVDLVSRWDGPVAFFHGEADFQVPVAQLEPAREALAARTPAVTFHTFPGLDHLFKRAPEDATLASYFTSRPVDPGLLAALSGWLDDASSRARAVSAKAP